MGRVRAFKGRQFTAEVILWAVRWYLMFPISYRDLELMLQDRGVEVDHTSLFRWIQAYAAELEKRIRPHLRTSNGPWRVDETYIRVKGRWMYLYRAVTTEGIVTLTSGWPEREWSESNVWCPRRTAAMILSGSFSPAEGARVGHTTATASRPRWSCQDSCQLLVRRKITELPAEVKKRTGSDRLSYFTLKRHFANGNLPLVRIGRDFGLFEKDVPLLIEALGL